MFEESQYRDMVAGVRDLVETYRARGLQAHFIDRTAQRQHAAAGLVPTALIAVLDNAPGSQQLPIGIMRTLLQAHLKSAIDGLPPRHAASAVAWVLDDDKRLMRSGAGITLSINVHCLQAVASLHELPYNVSTS